MDNALAPFVEMYLDWATLHRWSPSRRPMQAAADTNKLWLVRSGAVEVTVNGRAYKVRRGMAFLAAAQHQRSLAVNEKTTDLLAIGFNVTLFRGADLLLSLPEPVLWKPSPREYSALESWMLWLAEENFIKSQNSVLKPDAALEVDGLARAIFSVCWRHLEKNQLVKAPPQFMPDWIARALEYIRAEPSTSVAQWARAVGFSPAQFRRLFGQWLGASPQEYLARQRLEEARRLLATTDTPIGLISQQLGFSNPSHFTRRFKTQNGVAPALYRISLRENPGETF
jgi:AraC-like DNA-binding protein